MKHLQEKNRVPSLIVRTIQEMKTAALKASAPILLVLFFLSMHFFPTTAQGVRLKDIAGIQGMRGNELVGYGLVVGLNGSGDGTQAKFTIQSIANMMERMGINVNPSKIKVKNAAGVMVTAQMRPFAKIGQKLDVVVSSLGDAKSLQGGTLLLTPLRGVDGNIYALAQGSVIVGGFAVGGTSVSVEKNHPTAGRIPNGATVEKEIPVAMNEKNRFTINLFNPDFTTVMRAADSINGLLGKHMAQALDASTLNVNIPTQYQGSVVALLARIENLEIEPDQRAKVVLDERTGTVVMGHSVRISKVAIAQGNLSIQIKENYNVSQPAPFGRGQTVVTPDSDISVQEGGEGLVVLEEGTSIGELVQALNAVGVTPRDLISILQSLKAAGALQADLLII